MKSKKPTMGLNLIEILTATASKIIIILFAWAYYQVSDLTGGIVDEAFDRMFSLGLLVVVIFVIAYDHYRERNYNRSVIQDLSDYNRQRDVRIEQIVSETNQAHKDVADAVKELTMEVKILTESSRGGRGGQ